MFIFDRGWFGKSFFNIKKLYGIGLHNWPSLAWPLGTHQKKFLFDSKEKKCVPKRLSTQDMLSLQMTTSSAANNQTPKIWSVSNIAPLPPLLDPYVLVPPTCLPTCIVIFFPENCLIHTGLDINRHNVANSFPLNTSADRSWHVTVSDEHENEKPR